MAPHPYHTFLCRSQTFGANRTPPAVSAGINICNINLILKGHKDQIQILSRLDTMKPYNLPNDFDQLKTTMGGHKKFTQVHSAIWWLSFTSVTQTRISHWNVKQHSHYIINSIYIKPPKFENVKQVNCMKKHMKINIWEHTRIFQGKKQFKYMKVVSRGS